MKDLSTVSRLKTTFVLASALAVRVISALALIRVGLEKHESSCGATNIDTHP